MRWVQLCSSLNILWPGACTWNEPGRGGGICQVAKSGHKTSQAKKQQMQKHSGGKKRVLPGIRLYMGLAYSEMWQEPGHGELSMSCWGIWRWPWGGGGRHSKSLPRNKELVEKLQDSSFWRQLSPLINSAPFRLLLGEGRVNGESVWELQTSLCFRPHL